MIILTQYSGYVGDKRDGSKIAINPFLVRHVYIDPDGHTRVEMGENSEWIVKEDFARVVEFITNWLSGGKEADRG